MNRLQLIKNAVKVVQAENKNKVDSLERLAVSLSNTEYVTVSKQAAQNTELNFN
jgi:hypothetical protein